MRRGAARAAASCATTPGKLGAPPGRRAAVQRGRFQQRRLLHPPSHHIFFLLGGGAPAPKLLSCLHFFGWGWRREPPLPPTLSILLLDQQSFRVRSGAECAAVPSAASTLIGQVSIFGARTPWSGINKAYAQEGQLGRGKDSAGGTQPTVHTGLRGSSSWCVVRHSVTPVPCVVVLGKAVAAVGSQTCQFPVAVACAAAGACGDRCATYVEMRLELFFSHHASHKYILSASTMSGSVRILVRSSNASLCS